MPIKKAKTPINAAINATISNPNNTRGCLETIMILDFMASMESNFPKTINGIVKNVIKEIVKEIRAPMVLSPANSRRVESPKLNNPIINVAIKILEKNGNL